MLFQQKRMLGADLGTASIKLVEVSLNSDGTLAITGYAQEDVAPDADRGDVLKRLLGRGGFKTRKTASAISGRSAIIRYVTMLRMSDEDLKNAIRFEADKYIPFEIDEVVLDCQRLEEGETKEREMKILLVAVKRNLINDQVKVLKDGGFAPYIIDHDSFALGNAFEFQFQAANPKDPAKAYALIDVGAAKTSLNVIVNKMSAFTREIYIAGNDFTDAIAKRLGIDPPEAEKAKREPGQQVQEILEAVTPTFDDLGSEVHLSFDYFQNNFDRSIDEVYISGGGASVVGLEDAFNRILQQPIQRWDPTEPFEIDRGHVDVDQIKSNASQVAIALGLAARILGS